MNWLVRKCPHVGGRQRSVQSISVDQGRTKLCGQTDRPGGLNPVIQRPPLSLLTKTDALLLVKDYLGRL